MRRYNETPPPRSTVTSIDEDVAAVSLVHVHPGMPFCFWKKVPSTAGSPGGKLQAPRRGDFLGNRLKFARAITEEESSPPKVKDIGVGGSGSLGERRKVE